MKKIIGLVVVLAALVLGGYYALGYVTERTIKKNMGVMNQSNGLSVDITQYHRHWFSSEAVANIQIHVAEHVIENAEGKPTTIAAQEYALSVPVTIYHGPMSFTGSGLVFGIGYAEGHLNLPEGMIEKYTMPLDAKSKQPEIKFSAHVSYLNKLGFEVAIPAFKLVAKEGNAEADWLGMTSHTSVSSDLNHIDGRFTLQGIQLAKDKVKLVSGSVVSNYALHLSNEGLYLGKATVSVPSVVVTKDGAPLFELNKLDVTSDSDTQKDLFKSSFKLSLEKFFTNGKAYGPGLLEVSIENLDAKVLATINAQSNKMKAAVGAERQQVMFAMISELPNLLGQGAVLNVSTLKLVFPEGDMSGHVKVALPAGETNNPFQMIQKMEGEGKIQLPASLVRGMLIRSIEQKSLAQSSPQGAVMPQLKNDKTATPPPAVGTVAVEPPVTQPAVVSPALVQSATDEADKRLAAMVKAKLLVELDKDYVVELNLEKGQLKINGQLFDPTALKM